MRNIVVFQHVGHEPLGTLNPMLKAAGFRIKYVNFGRDPEAKTDLDGYNGLIVLGGPMSVNDAHKIPHLQRELKAIEDALKKDIPVLGICLGAQLIANVLGAPIRKAREMEIGWYDLTLTTEGEQDPLFSHFRKTEKIFQIHEDTFELPSSSQHLAFSAICDGQAFRYGNKVYGFQFHLEVDRAMIQRWLRIAGNLKMLEQLKGQTSADRIETDTDALMGRNLELSRDAFAKFIEIFNLPDRPVFLGSEHAKPGRK